MWFGGVGENQCTKNLQIPTNNRSMCEADEKRQRCSRSDCVDLSFNSIADRSRVASVLASVAGSHSRCNRDLLILSDKNKYSKDIHNGKNYANDSDLCERMSVGS